MLQKKQTHDLLKLQKKIHNLFSSAQSPNQCKCNHQPQYSKKNCQINKNDLTDFVLLPVPQVSSGGTSDASNKSIASSSGGAGGPVGGPLHSHHRFVETHTTVLIMMVCKFSNLILGCYICNYLRRLDLCLLVLGSRESNDGFSSVGILTSCPRGCQLLYCKNSCDNSIQKPQ